MNDASLEILVGTLFFLILCSAYFSGSETAMMSLNRYRLRHLARQRHGGAVRAGKLLEKPDRLIGVILIGNNFVNFLASSIGTILAIRLFGAAGGIISTAVLTFVFLIFAEVTPKTIAAMRPELIAYPSSLPLSLLLKLFYPLVWLVNTLSNSLLKLLGYDITRDQSHHLTSEEMRTVVYEAGARLPLRRQSMLLNVLDLENVTVNDIMVPRNEMVGIDIEADIDAIMEVLTSSQHTRLPVYRKDPNDVIGIFHMRNASRLLKMDRITQDGIMQFTQEPYFVPESTPLHTQLMNFQRNKRRIAIVVDEYGDMLGIVTLEDILEEIVGNFTTSLSEETEDIHPQEDGSYLIDGAASIREINRTLDWKLPTTGPKTLNGLLMEMLESIPETSVGVKLPHYHAEILQVKDNMIKTVRMWPRESGGGKSGPEPAQGSLFVQDVEEGRGPS